ncbi:MAG: DMT family transporter [Rhodobacter sp.]|nr:DMT family transporter [Rhodobacter sp.]
MDSLPTQRPFSAAGSILAAMVLIGLIDNLVFALAGISGIWQFHLVRSAMALPVIFVIAALGGRRIWPRRVWPVLGRSLLVSVSMVFYFGSLAFLPVAQAAAGLFTAPIFVLLISAVFLADRVTGANAVAALVGFAGVVLVLKPDLQDLSPATLMPVAAGFFYACGAMATRRWCGNEGTLGLLAAFFAVMAVWGAGGCLVLAWLQPEVPAGQAGFLLRGWVTPGWEFLGLTAVQALGAVAGVGLIIRGYLLAEASFVSVFEYVLLIFGAVWGYALWGQTVDWVQAAGIGLIIASGAVLARSVR